MSNVITIDQDYCLTTMSFDDIEPLALAINDKLISDNTLTIPYPYSKEDALQFLNIVEARAAEAGYVTNWLIKKHDDVIGGMGLVCQEGFDAHRTEFGYWMAAPYRSRGITTAAIRAFTKHVFSKLHFIRLEAHTFCDNIASQKVLEKNGFLREGLHRSFIKKGSTYKDVYCFSKLHPELNK